MLLKIYIMSVSIAAVLSFYIWEIVSNIVFPSGDGFVVVFLYNFGTYSVQAIVSTTGFVLIQFLLKTIINKNEYLKRKFLGSEYLDGYWVGYFTKGYRGEDGNERKEVRLVIERIEQSATSTIVKGWAYDVESITTSKPQITSDWSSKDYPIHIKNEKFIFGFKTTFYAKSRELASEKTQSGFIYYDLRENILENKKYPNELIGFFINLQETEKNEIHLTKVYNLYKKKFHFDNKKREEEKLKETLFYLGLAKEFHEKYAEPLTDISL